MLTWRPHVSGLVWNFISIIIAMPSPTQNNRKIWMDLEFIQKIITITSTTSTARMYITMAFVPGIVGCGFYIWMWGILTQVCWALLWAGLFPPPPYAGSSLLCKRKKLTGTTIKDTWTKGGGRVEVGEGGGLDGVGWRDGEKRHTTVIE